VNDRPIAVRQLI